MPPDEGQLWQAVLLAATEAAPEALAHLNAMELATQPAEAGASASQAAGGTASSAAVQAVEALIAAGADSHGPCRYFPAGRCCSLGIIPLTSCGLRENDLTARGQARTRTRRQRSARSATRCRPAMAAAHRALPFSLSLPLGSNLRAGRNHLVPVRTRGSEFVVRGWGYGC